MILEYSLSFLISQVLAGAALISDFVGFQFKKREQILMFCTFSVLFLSIHHFLLGNIAASLILFLAVIRYIISIFTTRKIILLIFLFLSCVVFIFSYETLWDFLVLIGTLLLTIAAFQKSEKNMRIINSFGFGSYLLFNIIIFSPFGVLARLNVLLSNLIGLYRHHKK